MDVRALVEEAQNAVWNGPNAADAALDSVTEKIAAEVRRPRTERDAALNLLEGYAPELTRRLRDQMAFERARATEGEP